ncbi:unnamed protein product [Polarella glacialis]|uniref:Uncharacterized protein n=1 Tax=Polarella glacialis TaxID=89957 RepID=A0A813KAN8_POLGL|nr:unnamed protein product [Polarella glacialis]
MVACSFSSQNRCLNMFKQLLCPTLPNCELQLVHATSGFKKSMLFIARKQLQKGTLLTLNYNSFEYGKVSSPFEDCFSGRTVNRFEAGETDEKKFLLSSGFAFPHVRKMWAAQQQDDNIVRKM